jgi:hypothetical protein
LPTAKRTIAAGIGEFWCSTAVFIKIWAEDFHAEIESTAMEG